MVRLLRMADIGVVSGLLAAILTAVGARLAMRLVAVIDESSVAAADVEAGFTGETGFVLFMVAIPAIKGGLLYLLIRRWLPGSTLLQGLGFGGLLLLLLGVPMMLFEADFDIGPVFVTWPLFGALFLGYGAVVAGLVRGMEALWPADRPLPALAITGFVPLAPLLLISLVLVIPFPGH